MDSRLARRIAVLVAVLAATPVAAETAAAHSPRPDLVVTKVSNPPATIGTGGTFRLSDRTANRGAGAARRSTTRYFIARSAAGQIGDEKGIVLKGSRTVAALGPGESAVAPREVVVPDVPAGTYDLVACADARNRVRETNDRNNCRAAARSMKITQNALPAVFIGGGAATGAVVDEGDPVLLAPAVIVTDDEARLTGAVASGAALGAGVGGVRSAFVLMQYFGVVAGITGTYNSGTGVLTLTGTASVADYQTALRSVWYRYLGDNPQGPQRVEIRVRDASRAWSKPVRQTVTVTPVNDAPVVSSAGPPDPGPLVGKTIALWDPDSALDGAKVEITSGFDPSADQLQFANQLGITGTYNSGTGVLTLTGTASVSDYQTALRSIRLVTSSSGQRQLRFQVRDAEGAPSNGYFYPGLTLKR